MPVKRLIVTILCCFLLGMQIPAATAQADMDAVTQSVFFILAYPEDENTANMPIGTAFAIGTEAPVQYLVSNFHVIRDAPDNVYVWLEENLFAKCEVVAADEEKDLVVLKMDRAVNRPPLVLGNRDLVKQTDAVYTFGFPKFDISAENKTFYPEDVTSTIGIISKLTQWEGVSYYQTDAPINEGNSGGPLVHKDGFVIGIVSIRIAQSDSVNGAIMTEELFPLLDANNVPYKTPTVQPSAQPSASPTTDGATLEPQDVLPGASKGPSIWLIIFIIAAVAFAGVAGYIVYQRFFRSRETYDGYDDYEPESGRARPARQAPPHSEEKPRTMQAPVAQRREKPMLRGLRGHYAGVELAIDGTIRIGRDARECQLIYPKDMPGISRVHCALRMDGNRFIVTDYSSTGTLVDGDLIGKERSVAARAGARVALGDETNLFELII